MLTTAQAAEYLGVSESRIRQMILDGTLPARPKFGRQHQICRVDLERVKDRPGPGRPAKKEPEEKKKKSRKRA